MGLGKCLPQNQPKPKRYLSVGKKGFFSRKSPFLLLSLKLFWPSAAQLATQELWAFPRKQSLWLPTDCLLGNLLFWYFNILSRGFRAVWNILNVAKSLKQSTHFYSCHRYYQCETWVSFYHWWFEFRGYCTSFGGNSQRYKLEILWSLSKTLNRRISNDRRYTDHR